MATLTDKTIATTYDQLWFRSGTVPGGTINATQVKTTSNDGANDITTPLYLGTARVGIGTSSPAEVLDVTGNGKFSGTLTCATSLTIGSAAMAEADLEKLDGITNGTAAANKAVVLDGSKNIATIGTIGCGAITSTGSSSFGATSFGGNNITNVDKLYLDNSGDTYIYEAATDRLDFVVGGDVNALVIKESGGVGKVGIGTATPSQDLHIYKAGGAQINLETSEETIEANDLLGAINFLGLDTAAGSNWVTHAVGASIQVKADGTWGDTDSASDAPARMEFLTESNTDDDGMGNVRMCIDSTGYVGIGTHTPNTSLEVRNPAAAATIVTINSSDTDKISKLKLRKGDYDRWQMMANGSDDNLYILDANADDGVYMIQGDEEWRNNTSDDRKKDNWEMFENATDKLNTLTKIGSYQRIDPDTKEILHDGKRNVGLSAQEVREIIPEAVNEHEDGYLGMCQAFLVPLLIKSVQELSAEVEKLKNG